MTKGVHMAVLFPGACDCAASNNRAWQEERRTNDILNWQRLDEAIKHEASMLANRHHVWCHKCPQNYIGAVLSNAARKSSALSDKPRDLRRQTRSPFSFKDDSGSASGRLCFSESIRYRKATKSLVKATEEKSNRGSFLGWWERPFVLVGQHHC